MLLLIIYSYLISVFNLFFLEYDVVTNIIFKNSNFFFEFSADVTTFNIIYNALNMKCSTFMVSKNKVVDKF